MEEKATVETKGSSIKQQEKIRPKELATWRIHVYNLHEKLENSVKDRVFVTATHLNYSSMVTLEVCYY